MTALGIEDDQPRRFGANRTAEADVAATWSRLGEVFDRAAEDEHASRIVGGIEQVVLLRSAERPDLGLLLTARGGGLEVQDAGHDAAGWSIELVLAAGDAARLAEGKLRTAMAIAAGRASFRGPVRQFLRVLPLVQAIVNPPVEMGTNVDEHGEQVEVVR